MSYVELHAVSAFSFLRGGSFPEQLAERAGDLEMPAIALLDRNGVYGGQRFSTAARECGVRPIIGAELSMADGVILPVLVENRTGYKNLCELLTRAHLRSEKGQCAVQWSELPEFGKGLVALFGIFGERSWPHFRGARAFCPPPPACCRRLCEELRFQLSSKNRALIP